MALPRHCCVSSWLAGAKMPEYLGRPHRRLALLARAVQPPYLNPQRVVKTGI
jgi:hypothetical protein